MGLVGKKCGVWTVRSMDTMIHPFHIHVNPFQILEVQSDLGEALGNSPANNSEEFLFDVRDYSPPWTNVSSDLVGTWRDTVMVPPFGYVKFKQCYDAAAPEVIGGASKILAGKFVFHCHFLAHEDTGLIHNVILKRPSPTTPPADPCGVAPNAKLYSAGTKVISMGWSMMSVAGVFCAFAMVGLVWHSSRRCKGNQRLEHSTSEELDELDELQPSLH